MCTTGRYHLARGRAAQDGDDLDDEDAYVDPEERAQRIQQERDAESPPDDAD
jgi:hypothetical protein